MRRLFPPLLVFWGFAAPLGIVAQDFGSFPPCAQTAALGMLPGYCQVQDYSCYCHDKALISALPGAFREACSPGDAAKALKWAKNVCLKYGHVTIYPSSSPPATPAPVPLSATATTTTTTMTTAPERATAVSMTASTRSTTAVASTAPILPRNGSEDFGTTASFAAAAAAIVMAVLGVCLAV